MPIEMTFTEERMIDQKATAASARKLRAACGCSRSEIADEMGISQPQLFYLETNKRKWTQKYFSDFSAACTKLNKKHES